MNKNLQIVNKNQQIVNKNLKIMLSIIKTCKNVKKPIKLCLWAKATVLPFKSRKIYFSKSQKNFNKFRNTTFFLKKIKFKASWGSFSLKLNNFWLTKSNVNTNYRHSVLHLVHLVLTLMCQKSFRRFYVNQVKKSRKIDEKNAFKMFIEKID